MDPLSALSEREARMLRCVYGLLAGAGVCVAATAARAEQPPADGDAQAQAPGDIVVTGAADPQSAAATVKRNRPQECY